jgi:hypothetical protein
VVLKNTSLAALQSLSVAMSRSKKPNAEAVEEEEEQYGPLQRVEDLDEKCDFRLDKALLTTQIPVSAT